LTDFHTLDELIEARCLLAEMSGVLEAIAQAYIDDPTLAGVVCQRKDKIDAFLARPLYGKAPDVP
jgi:hypothetical protein